MNIRSPRLSPPLLPGIYVCWLTKFMESRIVYCTFKITIEIISIVFSITHASIHEWLELETCVMMFVCFSVLSLNWPKRWHDFDSIFLFRELAKILLANGNFLVYYNGCHATTLCLFKCPARSRRLTAKYLDHGKKTKEYFNSSV